MSVIKKMRRQTAVLWSRNTSPDASGRFSYAFPVQVACRWDDQLGSFKNRDGEDVASNAQVYPDREVKVGDKFKKGSLDSETPDDPTDDRDAYEVQAVENIPNFKATETLHVAHL